MVSPAIRRIRRQCRSTRANVAEFPCRFAEGPPKGYEPEPVSRRGSGVSLPPSRVLPLTTATARIRAHVEQIESNPRVLVEPLYRIVVGGEVRQPNMYLLSPQLTVMQAVVQAGGPTERARRDRVRVLREGEEHQWDAARAYTEPLQSGDQIFVDRQRSAFREYVLPAIGVAGSIASILRFLR